MREAGTLGNVEGIRGAGGLLLEGGASEKPGWRRCAFSKQKKEGGSAVGGGHYGENKKSAWGAAQLGNRGRLRVPAIGGVFGYLKAPPVLRWPLRQVSRADVLACCATGVGTPLCCLCK